jgi:hypothetical protein
LIFDLIEMILTFALLSIFSTDRILWKERKGISVRCDHYDVAKQLKCSDHFPVWAAFQVPIKPGRETYTTLKKNWKNYTSSLNFISLYN